MALTRPNLTQFNSSKTQLSDPITVLNQGSTVANVDVGFVLNRNNGTKSNVALYWNETANTFVTAFTTSTGVTNANIAVTSYANLVAGSVTINGNLQLASTTGTPTNTTTPAAWLKVQVGASYYYQPLYQ